jgi:hypothetical protein
MEGKMKGKIKQVDIPTVPSTVILESFFDIGQILSNYAIHVKLCHLCSLIIKCVIVGIFNKVVGLGCKSALTI